MKVVKAVILVLKNLVKKHGVLLGVITGCLVAIFCSILLMMTVTDFGISFAAIAASLYLIFKNKKIEVHTIMAAYVISAFVSLIAITLLHNNLLTSALTLVIVFMILLGANIWHTPAFGFALSLTVHRFSLGKLGIVMVCVISIIALAKFLSIYVTDPDSIKLPGSNKIRFNIKPRRKAGFLVLNKSLKTY